jgi:redox-sensitive bicupin YhaK (pirin superfamily)
MTGGTSVRPVRQLIRAHETTEGAGFPIRRPFPTMMLDQLDPFLMLDEVGPVDWPPNEALGAPDHPHRGFETVTYVLRGEKLHEDSTGATETIGPGDVQWMTAGAGIVHSELPTPAMKRAGGRAHSFQIWVNLPQQHKWASPRYQHRRDADIPRARSDDGRIDAKVIAGNALGTAASIDTYTPVVLQDWTIHPGGRCVQPLPADHNAAVYVFDGTLAVGGEAATVDAGHLAILGPGDAIEVAVPETAATSARFLLLGGRPIGEPVARHGPFVMNTREELAEAINDYQSGRMGEIRRA